MKYLLLLVGILLAGCDVNPEDESTRVKTLIGGEQIEVMADIGAGEGDYLAAWVAMVGPGGRVFATEIDPGLVKHLEQRIAAEGLENVEVRTASASSTGLPAGCCDLIVLRHVYHHLSDPQATLADIHRALKPDGLLLLIDFRPAWRLAPWTPDDQPEGHSGHGVTPERIARETSAAGFSQVAVDDDWPGWHLLLDRFAILLVRQS
jgi:ubiquinone/menaquinone biosynthesis C-methylase UbiE